MGKPLNCISTKGKWTYKFRLTSLYWKLLGWEDVLAFILFFTLKYLYIQDEIDILWQDSGMTWNSSVFYIHGGLMNWRRFYTIFKMIWGIQQSLLARSHQKAGALFGTVVIFLLWRSGNVQKVPEFESFLYSESWIRDAQFVYSLVFKTETNKPPSTSLEMHWAYGPWSFLFGLQPTMTLFSQGIFRPYLQTIPVLWVARVPPFSAVMTAVPITTSRGNNGLSLGGPTISGECC